MHEFSRTFLNIDHLNVAEAISIQKKIDNKTKPLGALGKLETLAKQLALVLGDDPIPAINPCLLVFAAEHGIAERGVSIAPSAVTHQMVNNFLRGGAAINCFCRTNNISLTIINAGMSVTIDHPLLINQPSGMGTQDFVIGAAMTQGQLDHALFNGAKIAKQNIEQKHNVIALGEMGIGNTTSAAAIMAAVLTRPAKQCVGRGTGVDDKTLALKVELVEKAIAFHQSDLTSPFEILRRLGGFEIAQMVGAILQTAKDKKIILIDGFIATAAALIAYKINIATKDYMVFCHESSEQGHLTMLEYFNSKPLLNLDLRLGEGTGAALAIPLLNAAREFYNSMADFADAKVVDVTRAG